MKKVLSWALVLALVLSTFTVAFAKDTANSSEFKDASSIDYVEAVDVMVATGIINGYPDGTFGPDKTVTRAEMAKMISIMLEGGDDIGSTFAGSCPFKDSQNHWAAGYIAYCASQKIIDGRNANTFDPDATVTGTEAAKMALTALGYDSKIAGYTGENWSANVLKDAKNAELFDDMSGFTPAKACDRDAAAQILFNALQATKVEYDTSTTVTIGDAQVNVNSKVQDVEWNGGKNNDTDKKCGTNDGYKQLYEDAFGGDLVKKAISGDDFGRPAHQWLYDKDNVGKYGDEADKTFAVTDNFKDAAAAVKDYDKDYKVSKNIKMNGDEYTGDIQKGDTIELFETETTDTYDVVIIRYTLDKIDDIDTAVKSDDSKDGVKAYVTFVDNGKYNDNDITNFNVSDYAEDDVVAVAMNKAGDMIDSFKPEKVSGELTKLYSDKVAIDGKNYNALAGKTSVVTSKTFGDSIDTEDDVDLYLINGYAAGMILVDNNSDTVYGVVLKAGHGTFTNTSAKADVVKILNAKGDSVQYDVDDDNGVDAAKYIGKVVAYSINNDGTIDFVQKDMAQTLKLNEEDMTSKGLLAGQEVLDSVVVFDYDGTDPSDADNYDVFGYNDLKNAEDIIGDATQNRDGDIAAILTTDGLSSKDTMVAIYSTKTDAKSGSDEIYDVELFVNGDTANYDTKDRKVFKDEAVKTGDVVVVTFNTNKEITKIEKAKAEVSMTPSSDFDKDYVSFEGAGKVDKKSGKKLTINDYQINVAGASVYKMVNGTIDADDYTLADVQAGDSVVIYQFDEKSDTWDVIIVTPAPAPAENTEADTAN